MNAKLSLYFLLLGTSPLTVVPTTSHGKELMEEGQGRKGEQEGQFKLISKVNIFSVFSIMWSVKKCAFGIKHLGLLGSLE